MKIRIAPKGMGINEFVAMEEGFFAEAGLEVAFDTKILHGMQRSWKGLEYFERPQDMPYAEDGDDDVIQCACQWGTISNAASGMGRAVRDCYGVSPWGVFVRPDSHIREPADLADIPIAVGMRAGSHFNVPYRLEKHLPLDRIRTENIGGFSARLEALLSGEVEASSLLPPQIDMAKQLGLRSVIEDEFLTIWWVPAHMPKDVMRRYIDAMDRAERAIVADTRKFLPLWRHCIPPAFQDKDWNYAEFSRGERFVKEPLPSGLFDEVFEQVDRWGLAQHIQERTEETLVYTAA